MLRAVCYLAYGFIRNPYFPDPRSGYLNIQTLKNFSLRCIFSGVFGPHMICKSKRRICEIYDIFISPAPVISVLCVPYVTRNQIWHGRSPNFPMASGYLYMADFARFNS